MAEHIYSDGDLVTELIGACHQGQENAERLYQQLIVERRRGIEFAGRQIKLTENQLDEFTARFSAEVGVQLWQSKRRKT